MLRRNVILLGKPMRGRSRAGDAVPSYELDVEWIPRPTWLAWYHVDDARKWMMRETLEGRTESFDHLRNLHRTWGGTPLVPCLGDAEPKFPRGIYKRSHTAPAKFLVRWHKANHPGIWLGKWLIPNASWHYMGRKTHPDHYPKMEYPDKGDK